MTDPDVLKRTRAGHRGVATRRVKEVSDVFTTSPDPDEVKLDQVKRGLQETLDKLKKLDEDLLPHIDPGAIDKEIEDSEQIKDELFIELIPPIAVLLLQTYSYFEVF